MPFHRISQVYCTSSNLLCKNAKMIFQPAALSAESLGSSLLSLASLSDPNYIVHCYRCQKLVDFLLTRAVDCDQHSAFRHIDVSRR